MSSAVVPSASPPSSGGYMAAQSAARGLGPSTSTSLVAGDRRKIHTSFTGAKGAEMVEEYDLQTDALLLRKLRHKSNLGAWGPWEFEVGEAVAKFHAEKDLLLESASQNPLFVRQDTREAFQFRIRNLPYPYDNYLVTIEPMSGSSGDDAAQEIVLRTVNKKYYKRMSIPDLKAGGPGEPLRRLEEKSLTWQHANNTLIISYAKPPFIRELERRNAIEIRKMGNGATSSNAQPTSGSAAPKATTAAQALLAEAQSNAKSTVEETGGQFAGLNGLKGLANSKDADCKQQ